MAFIDEMKVHLTAGRGGDGVVRWRHEKGKAYAGASGGNGGRGGNVYIRGTRDVGILAKYRNVKEYKAGRGGDGEKNSMHGRDGEDFTFDLPVGSIVTNLRTREIFELVDEGQTLVVLKGGRGGLGNEHFKSSVNTTPWESTKGVDGEDADFFIELELIVDAGLIGFPNAGKSSVLNVITNADAKVGSYAFTTLEPNLGDLYGFIVADIPGLIEGASEGKGLGHTFLRHVKRTKMLVHCISLENESITDAYTTIRNELKAFHPELVKKPEIILLTKTDTLSPNDAASKDALAQKIAEAKKLNASVYTISIYDDAAIKQFSDTLVKLLRTA